MLLGCKGELCCEAAADTYFEWAEGNIIKTSSFPALALVTRLPGPPTTHMLCYKDSKFNCSPGVTSGHCEQLSPCYPANLTNIISFCQSIFYRVSSIFCDIFCRNYGMRFMFQLLFYLTFRGIMSWANI